MSALQNKFRKDILNLRFKDSLHWDYFLLFFFSLQVPSLWVNGVWLVEGTSCIHWLPGSLARVWIWCIIPCEVAISYFVSVSLLVIQIVICWLLFFMLFIQMMLEIIVFCLQKSVEVSGFVFSLSGLSISIKAII